MAPDTIAPALREFPVPPKLVEGAMAGSRPYVANAKVQEAIGFPGELVPDWHDRAIGHLGQMLDKYRSLRVYLDACVHCGACSDKCHRGHRWNRPPQGRILLEDGHEHILLLRS